MNPPPPGGAALKSKGGLGRLRLALGYSLKGLVAAFRHEAAFRQELDVVLVLTPVVCWLPVSAAQRLALFASMLLVLIVELLNSALETVVDRISDDHHLLSGRAKDIGSAAVLLALLLSVLTWLVIAGPVVLRQFH